MESVLLMLNVLAVAVLVFTSLRNDRLKAGEEPSGPFRFSLRQPKARAGRERSGRALAERDRTERDRAERDRGRGDRGPAPERVRR